MEYCKVETEICLNAYKNKLLHPELSDKKMITLFSTWINVIKFTLTKSNAHVIWSVV